MKKIARTLRAHRTLLLNYFKARKQFSSGVIEGLNNKAKVTVRRSMVFAPSASWNSRSITHSANYPSRSLPMNSSDESKSLARNNQPLFKLDRRMGWDCPDPIGKRNWELGLD
jgi:hypothetical protein